MARQGLTSMDELQRRSTTDIAWFWESILNELDIRFEKPYAKIVDLSNGIPWPQWCLGGRLNIIQNCLDKYAGTATDNKIALRWERETGTEPDCTRSYAQLRRDVNKTAGYLHSHGLGKGDVIGVFMPMTPECVIAMLAIIKIGAIFLPLFSGFGASAVASRLADAGAVALITVEHFQRRGQKVPLGKIAEAAAEQVKSVQHVIVWSGSALELFSDESLTESTEAENVMMILYTSGTTGHPKGAVHTHCGFPVKAAQDIWMGLDLHTDETLFWVTDMGWMMGPWQVFGTLLLGATMLIYDGALDYPSPDRLWSLVENHRVTALGISPTLVRALIQHGEDPPHSYDLTSLRKLASTGEPWNPDSWLWLFRVIGKEKLPIINYSGGTEISGGIVMGNVLTPMKPCAFSGPLPGMAADVVDDNGQSVRGQVGELVIRQPWIGMTRGFWRDPQRYLDSYWARFPNVWDHGDWAAIDDDGLWYILGRSDDTIKLAGKRLGPAEVESILNSHPSVLEAAAIGVPDPLKGEALVCFCVLKPGCSPSESLGDELKDRLIQALGKPFAPRDLKFVRGIPKTRNAKIVRRVIRAAFLNGDPGDVSSVENPDFLEDFVKRGIE
jgi:acetyl-CoA synthetase